MATRRGIMGVALAVAVLGASVWLVLRSREVEPAYEGRPLDYWLAGYTPPYPAPGLTWLKADEAVRHAGTNALPTLLRRLRAHDSSLALRLLAVARKQSLITIHHVPADALNLQARLAFRTLGPVASNAVPAIIRLLEREVSQESQCLAVDSLGDIGPPASAAVPVLLHVATNADASVRGNSIWALGRIHARPEIVVPSLIQALRDPSGMVRAAAVAAAGEFGPAARPAVPALIAAAADTEVKLRDSVVEALKKIDPAAAETLAGTSLAHP